MQNIITATADYVELDKYFDENGASCILLVCDGAFDFLNIKRYFETLESRKGIRVVKFTDFQPNPLYDSVVKGVEVFHKKKCDLIAAIGGGSAMDVAKCIKLYSNMDSSENYLKQTIVPNDVPLFAVPTTAGTGSEATRFAVIYYNGEKQSVADYSCIPSTVLFDASALKTLPIYQKKSTMMDALCHAVESFWSVNSNEESMAYSREAICMIIDNMNSYLANEDSGNANMLKAANLAGKAINITQTTAGHAMCYKLTSLYGLAHGHAAAVCDKVLIPYMLEHLDDCIDARGANHLEHIFAEIAAAFGCDTDHLGERFAEIVNSLELTMPEMKSLDDIDVLKTSVNPVRLKNHPISLSIDSIEWLYRMIMGVD